ncbi:hypothetical protein SAMN05216524_108144 [Mucilaginibacter sp. OK098]|nr:hypothetical protein SAMN05216524_108144 [Mucilaginibacter sp. OK098]
MLDKNHHLPNVAAAAEIKKNGINPGEMNKVLVQKLTLYLIEKDKKEKDQASQLKLLKNQLNKLSQKFSYKIKHLNNDKAKITILNYFQFSEFETFCASTAAI